MKFLPVDVIQVENEAGSKSLALLQGDALAFAIRRDGFYEKHFYNLTKQIIKPGDYAVDMGANLGYHTVTLANLVGNAGRVYAFEPQRIIFQQLNCNVFLNKLDNVYTFNAAVGEDNSFVHIEDVDYYKTVEGSYGTNIGNTSVNLKAIGEKVPKITLDSLKLPRVDFIKIDIQGCEMLALLGAKNTIATHRPVMFVEMENPHLKKFNTNEKELRKYIKGLGYKILQVKNEYPCDHVCIPDGRDLPLTLDYPLVPV